MKPFQAVLLVVFAMLAMIAVFVFATFSTSPQAQVGNVTIWGSLPKSTVDAVLSEAKRGNQALRDVSYEFIPEDALPEMLVEAIAAGRSPDLVVFPAASLLREQEKLLPISYRSISRRNFQDAYIESGEVFLSEEGILGLPFYVDPFVMFWNRTLFSNAGVARAPRYWDEVSEIAPALSKKTEAGTLVQSTAALGEWDNINHAKQILVSLIVGLGNPIVAVDGEGVISVTLSDRSDEGVAAGESALRFYTEFADPVSPVYSWSRSRPNAQSAFTAGTLGIYFAPASEVTALRAANPNLNFDVASYPQMREGDVAVPAALYALSIPRGSANQQGALQAAAILAGNAVQEILAEETGLPSVRRDILSVSPENPYESIFRSAALNAFVFRDLDPKITDNIFKRMIENVSSGKFRIGESVRNAQTELKALVR